MEYGIATDGMERVRRLLEIEWSELTAHTQLLEPSRWRGQICVGVRTVESSVLWHFANRQSPRGEESSSRSRREGSARVALAAS